MVRFRKRPVEIEAEGVDFLLDAAQHSWKNLPDWVQEAYDRGDILFLKDSVQVTTLEGTHIADADCMLIQGVEGELYGCRKDIFRKTYEIVFDA